jgi:hypothetical protein
MLSLAKRQGQNIDNPPNSPLVHVDAHASDVDVAAAVAKWQNVSTEIYNVQVVAADTLKELIGEERYNAFLNKHRDLDAWINTAREARA